MFYKLNVHAGKFFVLIILLFSSMRYIWYDVYSVTALQASDITAFFEPIFEQAKELRKAYSRFSSQTKMPFITVSC